MGELDKYSKMIYAKREAARLFSASMVLHGELLMSVMVLKELLNCLTSFLSKR